MEYMNVLIKLIEILDKPSQNHSENELNNANNELNELMEVGFKLDWLKSKLDDILLKNKKADADGFRVQQLEERVKTIELMELESLKTKLEEVSLDRKKSDDADGSRFQQLEERLKNIELMELGFRVENCLKSKLDEVFFLDQMKKSDDAYYGSRVQQLEESVKDLKMMVSDLKVEMEKERAKSFADEFCLVDEVA